MIVIKHRTSPDVILLRVEASSLDGFDLCEAYLPGAVLAGTRCRGTLFRDATLRKADLRGTDLQEADLRGANLTGADLTGANLAGTLLEGTDFTAACLRSADVRGADLSGARISLADLTDVLCDDRTRWPVNLENAPRPAPEAPASVPARTAALAWWNAGTASRLSLAAVAAAAAFLAFVVFTDLTSDRLQIAPPTIAAIPPRKAPAQAVRRTPERLASHLPRPVSSASRSQRIARAETGSRAAQRSWKSRTAGVRQVAQFVHTPEPEQTREARRGSRPRPRVILAARTETAPRRLPVAAAAPAPESVVAPVKKVVAERPEPPQLPFEPITPRGPRIAWGNRDFHDGSGYDIYRMHVPGAE